MHASLMEECNVVGKQRHKGATSPQARITNGPDLPVIERTAFYAPLPIIVLTCDNRIADFNLAAQTLFGPHIDEYRSQHVTGILNGVCSQLPAWLFPDNSNHINGQQGISHSTVTDSQTEVVPFESPDYGKGRLRLRVADFISPGNGERWYRILYTEILALKEIDRFASDLTGHWHHQLTWESYAISYDRILLRMDYYQEVLSRHLAALSKPSIHHVIDLGAGTGNLAEMLLTGSQRRVTAVDSSRAMLARMRVKLGEHIGKKLLILEQNAESLGQLDNESLDGVSILLALFDMHEPIATLNEGIRILRPGGVLIVTEPKYCFRKEPILEHIEHRLKDAGIFSELEEDFKRVTNANRKIDPESRSTHSPLRAEDIYKILRRREFESLTIKDSHFGNCATVCGIKT
jgi:ubiquinone/menaquinone biosynthesis C-methylase UbiE